LASRATQTPHSPQPATDLVFRSELDELARVRGARVFYLIGPFMGFGTPKEPLIALGVALVWAVYGGVYFVRASKGKGRTTLVAERGMGTAS
jgi:hypothetical protein